MPSCSIWRSMGPACGSMPPKKMPSGFFDLMAVRMAMKSVALSVVNCSSTISMPLVLAVSANTLATPWP